MSSVPRPRPEPGAERTALAVRSVTKRYPGVVALDGVTVELRDGEVLGVVGENGAGKSTLLDVLSGVVAPDDGHVELGGEPVSFGSHRAANERGVFRVFQEQALIGNLRVDEALLLGHEDRLRRGPLLARRPMQRRAQALLDELGVPVDARARVETLDLGHRQAVEIARALLLAELLGIERPVVLFDEATAALDRAQVDAFLGWVSALRGRASVVLVSHFLPEVLETADRVVVLKDGALVTQAPAAELDEPKLHALMVGRERAANHHREDLQRPPGEQPLLRVRELALPGVLHGVSLDVHTGEVVGVGGLLGSGKSDLVRAVAGALPGASGTVQLGDDAPMRPRLRRLQAAGLGFVPAERGTEGLVLDASLLANVQLPSLHDRFAPHGWWRRGAALAATRRWIERLAIAAPGPATAAGALSGGGQQKVVLAKQLERAPRVLLLDSPTRGVDTGAREAIYTVLRDLCERGCAVLLATDDLAELIGLSHRVVVMARGRVAAVVDAPAGAKPSEQELVTLMSGTPEAAAERSAA
jgi:ABC-type sugar transport system ATPase subunit